MTIEERAAFLAREFDCDELARMLAQMEAGNDRALARAAAAGRERDGLAAVAGEMREALVNLRASFRWGSDPPSLTDEDRAIIHSRGWLDGKEVLRTVIDPVLDRPLPDAAERVRKLAEAVEAWRVADAGATRAWAAYEACDFADTAATEVARLMTRDAEKKFRAAEQGLRALAESALPPTGEEDHDGSR